MSDDDLHADAPADPEGERPDDEPTADPEPPGPRRLVRRTDNRLVGGVAGGFADYFNIDPVLARLVFVGLALYGGIGVLVYLVCWAVIPPASEPATVRGESAAAPPGRADEAARSGETIAKVVGVVLLGIAALIVARGVFGWVVPNVFPPGYGPGSGLFWMFTPNVLLAVLLVIGGIVLYQVGQRGERPRPPDAPSAAVPPPPARSSTPAAPAVPAAIPPAPAPPPPAPPPPAPPPPEKRPSSPLGRLTLAMALLAVGVAALLHQANVIDLRARDLLAITMITVGLGLLAGAWWGRARWLIGIGFALLPFVIVAVFLPVPVVQGGQVFPLSAGEQFHQPLNVDEVREQYSLSTGRLVLDLTRVAFPPGEHTMTVSVAAGQILVLLPPDADAVLSASARVGSVELLNWESAGVFIEEGRSDSVGSDSLVRLQLAVGAGEILVQRPGVGEQEVQAPAGHGPAEVVTVGGTR